MADIYNLLTLKMAQLTREKEVYADNILRSPMPGAREKVVKFKNLVSHFSSSAAEHGLVNTHGRHLALSSSQSSVKAGLNKKNADVTLSGNTINAEQQLRNLNTATTKYYEMLNLYQSYMRRHNTIISGR